MNTLYAASTSHFASLRGQLATIAGLPEASAAALATDAIPAMIVTLGTGSSLGSPEAVWEMCQHLYLGQAQIGLPEMTRTDEGWPERRTYLAQTLLGATRFAALVQRHAPTAPAQAAHLLGYLAVVVLATVGQHSTEAVLPAPALQAWLRQQAAAFPETAAHGPAATATATAATAASPPPIAKSALSSGSRWPLAVLALVGVAASSYFWQQQQEAELISSQKKAVALVSVPAVAAASPSATVAATSAAPAADSLPQAATTLTPVTVSVKGSPETGAATTTPVALAMLRTAPGEATAARALPVSRPRKAGAARAHMLADTVGNAKLAALVGGHFDAQKGAYARDPGTPLMLKLPRRTTLLVGVNSTESLLYKRLASPELPNRQSIDLDRLTFGQGEARLDMEGAQQLGNVANLLKTFPRRVVVFGSAEPTEPQSLTLALGRANAVLDELVKQGVPSQALQAQGRLRTTSTNPNDPDFKRRASLYISPLD